MDKPTLVAFNKIDAYGDLDESEFDYTGDIEHSVSLEDLKNTWMSRLEDHCVFISAAKRENIPQLRKELYEMAKKIHATRFPYHDFLY